METSNKKNLVLQIISFASILIAFILNIVLFLMPLESPFSDYNLRTYVVNSKLDIMFLIGLILLILTFLSLVPILFCILGIIRKRTTIFIISCAVTSVIDIGFIIFKVFVKYVYAYTFIICSACLLLVILALILTLIVKKSNDEIVEETEEISENQDLETIEHPKDLVRAKRKAKQILVVDILSIASLFVMLFVPIYYINTSDGLANAFDSSLIMVLFRDQFSILNSILFIVFFLLIVLCVLHFILSSFTYLSNKTLFVKESKITILYNFSATLALFLVAFGIQFFYSVTGVSTLTLSYIPFILMCVLLVFYSILKGQYDYSINAVTEIKSKKAKYYNIEPLIFIFIVTIVTVCSLFLNYIDITFKDAGFGESINFTGIKLLQDYASLDRIYQILAFLVVVMLGSSGILFLFSVCAYFSHYKNFKFIAKITFFSNVFWIFLFGISAFYFTIAQQVNVDNINKLIAFYKLDVDVTKYTYSIKTDTFYALIVDVAIVSVAFFRKAFDQPQKQELLLANPEDYIMPEKLENNSTSSSKGGMIDDELEISNFDPCPAFSEIDGKKGLFDEDLKKRMLAPCANPNLSTLCEFVVDYAKNSRLHLSYNKKDIATFVSGLGAARLTILQGMSGTGKTSLPKIFSEAISGNCEIIEVESSWKDKNELLGYYNEFSSIYTPKKFTQALYRATLNPKIPTFIVLDEMNLSRIEYYFSDFLSLMENEEDKRLIKLVNIELNRKTDGEKVPYLSLIDGHTVKVSPNIWFIGTANRDESTFVISDKVYDRAHTINFNKRAPKVLDASEPLKPIFYTVDNVSDMFKNALKNESFNAEGNYIIKEVEKILSPYNISFGNRILNQIESFVKIYKACFPKQNVEAEAVETILLSKVVSKLELKTIEDKNSIIRAFNALSLARCAEFVNKLNED